MKKRLKRKEKVKKKVTRKKDDEDVTSGDAQGKTARNGIGSNLMVSVGKMLFRRTLGAHCGTNSFQKFIEQGKVQKPKKPTTTRDL